MASGFEMEEKRFLLCGSVQKLHTHTQTTNKQGQEAWARAPRWLSSHSSIIHSSQHLCSHLTPTTASGRHKDAPCSQVGTVLGNLRRPLFSKCGLGTSSVTCELVKHALPQALPRDVLNWKLPMRTSGLCFSKNPGDPHAH